MRIYSALIDCGSAAVRTWFGLRALDTAGSGFVRISLEDFSKSIGLSIPTIYRHLRDQRFFPVVKRSQGGFVTVSYRGIVKLCVLLGIESGKAMGACTEFLFEWLGDRSLCAAYATEIEAQQGQTQAYYAAQGADTEDKDKIINPDQAVVVLSKKERAVRKGMRKSGLCRGFKPRRAFRFFRIRFDQSVPGITQVELGKRLGRTERTIRRRLSNKSRARWGIAPLNRRRVIQEFTPAVEKRMGEYLQALRTDFVSVAFGDRTIQVGKIKIGNEAARPYRLLTNIYEFGFELLSGRKHRAKLNRLAGRIQSNTAPKTGA